MRCFKVVKMSKGFSLIELLVVLAIAGILTMMAYPGYRDSLTRAHRSDGKTALLELAIRMENYYSKNNTYQTATIGTGATTDVLSNASSPEGFYELRLSNLTDLTYNLEARAIDTQARADTYCQLLSYNSLGVKGVKNGSNGRTADPKNCW